VEVRESSTIKIEGKTTWRNYIPSPKHVSREKSAWRRSRGDHALCHAPRTWGPCVLVSEKQLLLFLGYAPCAYLNTKIACFNPVFIQYY